MADTLRTSLFVAGAGMKAQGTRLRVISENVANAESTAKEAGGDPYRRKTISFRDQLDLSLNADLVKVGEIGQDPSDFKVRYEPSHPAADAEGYVKFPNVTKLVEIMDMREAQRSYEANLSVLEVTKSMVSRTLDLLR